MKLQEDDEVKISKKAQLQGSNLPAIIITNILEAMAANSTKARDRFPRLLELIGTYNDSSITDLFIKLSKRVPNWMFIRWISQMMAVLNQPTEASAVLGILMEVLFARKSSFNGIRLLKFIHKLFTIQ